MTAATLSAGLAAIALAATLAQLHGVPAAAAPIREAPPSAAGRLQYVVARVGATNAGRRALSALLAFVVVAAVIGLVAGVLAGVAVGAAGAVRVRRAAAGRRHSDEIATPALARSLADALRGGASVRGALIAAGQDAAVPTQLRRSIAREAAALAAGASLVPTLRTVADRSGPTLRLLCGTLAMHLDAGGALASELDRLATDAEAARRVEEERQAATAQARATVRVVAALPLLAMGGAQLASPGFLGQVVASPVALGLLVLGLTLEIVAVLAARAIVGRGA